MSVIRISQHSTVLPWSGLLAILSHQNVISRTYKTRSFVFALGRSRLSEEHFALVETHTP